MRHLTTALACTLLLAGCPAPKAVQPPTTAGANPAVPAGQVAVGTVVTGSVLAPANMVAAGGGNLVGNDGASIISSGQITLVGNDGGSMVAAGGGNYALAQAGERRIAGAAVFLADAAGNPVPGLPAATTDAQGRYTFRGVPAGYAFQVVAKARLADGRDARLSTLVRSAELGATAPIGAETTIATAAVLGGLTGGLGAFGEATYARIVEVARRAKPADWTKLEAVAKAVADLQAEAAELKALVATMREEIAQLRQSLDDLKADVAKTAQPTPAPTPARTTTPAPATPAPEATPTPAATATPADAGPVVTFRMPNELRSGMRSAAAPDPGAWAFLTALPGMPLQPLAWAPTAEVQATYVDQAGFDQNKLAGANGVMTVEPGEQRATVIAWRPPSAGRLAWRLAAASDTTADGVRVKVARLDVATGASTPVDELLVLAKVPAGRSGVLDDLAAGEAIAFAFDKNVTRDGDACTVELELGFSARPAQ